MQESAGDGRGDDGRVNLGQRRRRTGQADLYSVDYSSLCIQVRLFRSLQLSLYSRSERLRRLLATARFFDASPSLHCAQSAPFFGLNCVLRLVDDALTSTGVELTLPTPPVPRPRFVPDSPPSTPVLAPKRRSSGAGMILRWLKSRRRTGWEVKGGTKDGQLSAMPEMTRSKPPVLLRQRSSTWFIALTVGFGGASSAFPLRRCVC